MNFASQNLVWAVPTMAVVLALVHGLSVIRRQRAIATLGDAEAIARMANSVSAPRRKLRASLGAIALVLCAVALARPTTTGEVSWRQRGIDVVFVVDASKSMLATDVYPNRFDRSLREVATLMDGLAADRVGTVVFAGGAAHFPLTHDHLAAQLLFQGLRPSDVAAGADLGLALRLASCSLRAELADPKLCELLIRSGGGIRENGGAPQTGEGVRAEAPAIAERGRAIVLFTDGEDTEGTALREAELAKALGIELFVAAVGTNAGELVPGVDSEGHAKGWERARDGSFVTSRLNGALLREASEVAGGSYYGLGEGQWRGDELLTELRELARGDLDARVIRHHWHIFDRFLFPAFLLLIIEGCLTLRRRSVLLPTREGL